MKKNKILTIIVLLVTIFGTLDVNAATAYVESFPETVTRAAIAKEYKFNESGIKVNDKTSAIVEYLSEDGKYLLYCSDRNNLKYETKVTLTKGNKMDYKIAYVLKKGYNQQNLFTGTSTDQTAQGLQPGETETAQANKGDNMANLWITQVAIWNLQNTITSADLVTDNISYTIDSLGTFYIYHQTTEGRTNLGSGTLWQYVKALTDSANSAKDPSTATLSVTGSTEWTKSDNISKSGLITISSSSDSAKIANYSVSLADAPEGVKVYTEDGNDITNKLDNIAGGKKIYITVDNNKLDKSKEYNFKLNAKANITYDAAYQYVDNSNQCDGQACQPSVLVGPETKEIVGDLNLKIVPDTASSLSKSIYYIGFIVLLCGVGMIYANVRPKRQEEE